jgi:hypothetical protein
MWSAVVPEMKIEIKARGDNTAQRVNVKAHNFARNRDPKMIGTQEFHMKTIGFAPNA